jgi:hypothetical protein
MIAALPAPGEAFLRPLGHVGGMLSPRSGEHLPGGGPASQVAKSTISNVVRFVRSGKPVDAPPTWNCAPRSGGIFASLYLASECIGRRFGGLRFVAAVKSNGSPGTVRPTEHHLISDGSNARQFTHPRRIASARLAVGAASRRDRFESRGIKPLLQSHRSLLRECLT